MVATHRPTVIGMVGSLREDSWNRKLWHIAQEVLAEAGAQTIEAKPALLPHYDGDVEAAGFPEAVTEFRTLIQGGDALFIVSPEYNSSVPGFLKNAIDWGSRPPNIFRDKAVFVMGASPGRSGTIRMRMHMENVLAFVGAWVVPSPRIHLPEVANVIGADGQLLDPSVRVLIREGVDRLLTTGRLLSGSGQRD